MKYKSRKTNKFQISKLILFDLVTPKLKTSCKKLAAP